MFKFRFWSSVVLVIVVGACVLLGGPFLYLFDLFISLIAYLELTKCMGVRGDKKKPCLLEIVGALCVVSYYLVLFFVNNQESVMFVFAISILSILIIYVFKFPKYEAKQVLAAGFSFFYAPVMLSYLFLTRELEGIGRYAVWLIFISSWICDTCAYIFGMLLGKHKLCPHLSPKKSIEGAVGGVFGSAVVGCIYAFILLKLGVVDEKTLWVFPVISSIGACVSQVGDLSASAIKRNFGIKDYGKLIPGHGGIMDRFDSVIFTAPMIYFLTVFLLK